MTTVAQATQMISQAYKAKNDVNGNPIQSSVNIPSGWTLLKVIDNTSEKGDAAAVFANHTTKEIFIAGRGTATLNDLKPDLKIALGQLPKERIDDATNIINTYRTNFSSYDITAGGHSLDGDVYAKVSEGLHGGNTPLYTLVMDSPNTFDSTGKDSEVLAIRARYDFVGHYGIDYQNSLTIDTNVIGGPLNQFGTDGTHSIDRLTQYVLQNSMLSSSTLGKKLDFVGIIATGNASMHIN